MEDRHQTTALRQRYPLVIDDGRGFLPDRFAIGLPVGMKADIKRAATAAGISVSDFVRGVLLEKLQTFPSEI